MAVVDEIAIKLGIQTGDLKAALADADASIKKFRNSGKGETSGVEEGVKGISKAFGDLKKLVVGGGIATAVLAFFDSMVERANKSKGVVDENTLAVRRWGEAFADQKNTVMDWGVQVMGFFNRAGENIGNMVNWMRVGIDETERQDKQLKDSTAQLDEFNKRMEERKKHTQEIAAAHKDLAKAQQEEQQIRAKAIGTQAELDLAIQNYWKKLVEISNFKGQEWERDKLLVEAQKNKNDLLQAEANVRKEAAAAAEKLADIDKKNAAAELEVERNRADYAREHETALVRRLAIEEELEVLNGRITDGLKKHVDMTNEIKRAEELRGDLAEIRDQKAQDNIRLAVLYLKGVENLTAIEKEELLLLEGKTTKLKQQAELQLLLDKGVKNLTEAEKARLGVLIGQTAEVVKQQAVVEGMIAQWTNFQVTFGRKGGDGDLTRMTDAELKERERNIASSIADTKLKSTGGNAWLTDIWAQAQTGQLEATRQELNTRTFFRNNVKAVGSEAALNNVSAFEQDRYNFYLTQTVDLAKDTNEATNALLATLSKIAPKSAVPKGQA